MTTTTRSARSGRPGSPEVGGDERATLLAALNGLRDAVAAKAAGVAEPEIRRAGVASGTNLLGLIKHLGHVERFYFLGQPIRDLNRTLRPTAGETLDGLLADYRDAVARANDVVERCADLSEPAPRPPGRTVGPTMRWVLVHMIEETARHAGHADILREQIDGATGR